MSQSANWPVPPPGASAVGTAASAAGTIFPSASYTVGTTNSSEIFNPSAKGVRLFINVSNANAGTVTVSIQTKDPISGNWANAPDGATTAAINANGTSTLTVYPGIAETANAEISDQLGISWRVVLVVATNPVTLSVSGFYLA